MSDNGVSLVHSRDTGLVESHQQLETVAAGPSRPGSAPPELDIPSRNVFAFGVEASYGNAFSNEQQSRSGDLNSHSQINPRQSPANAAHTTNNIRTQQMHNNKGWDASSANDMRAAQSTLSASQNSPANMQKLRLHVYADLPSGMYGSDPNLGSSPFVGSSEKPQHHSRSASSSDAFNMSEMVRALHQQTSPQSKPSSHSPTETRSRPANTGLRAATYHPRHLHGQQQQQHVSQFNNVSSGSPPRSGELDGSLDFAGVGTATVVTSSYRKLPSPAASTDKSSASDTRSPNRSSNLDESPSTLGPSMDRSDMDLNSEHFDAQARMSVMTMAATQMIPSSEDHLHGDGARVYYDGGGQQIMMNPNMMMNMNGMQEESLTLQQQQQQQQLTGSAWNNQNVGNGSGGFHARSPDLANAVYVESDGMRFPTTTGVINTAVCKFYTNGHCVRGEQCNFAHISPTKGVGVLSASMNNLNLMNVNNNSSMGRMMQSRGGGTSRTNNTNLGAGPRGGNRPRNIPRGRSMDMRSMSYGNGSGNGGGGNGVGNGRFPGMPPSHMRHPSGGSPNRYAPSSFHMRAESMGGGFRGGRNDRDRFVNNNSNNGGGRFRMGHEEFQDSFVASNDLLSKFPPNPSIEDLIGNIYLLAKDQYGCRLLQRLLDEQKVRVATIVFNEVFEHMNELMTDPFGNYLCQKLIEHCHDNQRLLIIDRVASDLVAISLNIHGTRAVQKLVETVQAPKEVALVVSALQNSVVTLIKDLNGNHVIQRCLHHMTSANNQFIYDAVAAHLVSVATHKHGCCVLQRCMDYATPRQKRQLIQEIVNNALELVQDAFGNYVVQYTFKQNDHGVSQSIIANLLGHVSALAVQKFSSNVVEKSLELADEPLRTRMIDELTNAERLPRLLQDPYANYVIQKALTVSKRSQFEQLVEVIKPHLASLRNTSFGKRIQNNIRKKFPDFHLDDDFRNAPHDSFDYDDQERSREEEQQYRHVMQSNMDFSAVSSHSAAAGGGPMMSHPVGGMRFGGNNYRPQHSPPFMNAYPHSMDRAPEAFDGIPMSMGYAMNGMSSQQLAVQMSAMGAPVSMMQPSYEDMAHLVGGSGDDHQHHQEIDVAGHYGGGYDNMDGSSSLFNHSHSHPTSFQPSPIGPQDLGGFASSFDMQHGARTSPISQVTDPPRMSPSSQSRNLGQSSFGSGHPGGRHQ